MLRLTLLCLFVAACRSSPPAAEAPAAPAPVEAPAKPVPVAAPEPVAKAEPEPEAAAEPAVAAPEDDDKCNVEGFVLDDHAGGVPLREGPSEDDEIAGGLWPYEDGTVLEIVRGREGWVEVHRARQIEGADYNVEGWLSGQKVGTEVRCPDEEPGPDCGFALRAGPAMSEAQGRRVAAGDRVKVIGCRGEWVLAETMEEAASERAQGWLAPKAQCPNPVTSCP